MVSYFAFFIATAPAATRETTARATATLTKSTEPVAGFSVLFDPEEPLEESLESLSEAATVFSSLSEIA